MDTEVVEPAAPSNAPLGESGFERVPGPPEVTIDEVDQLLDEVEAALSRLDEGTYGTCRGCGTPIDDTRLAGSTYRPDLWHVRHRRYRRYRPVPRRP